MVSKKKLTKKKLTKKKLTKKKLTKKKDLGIPQVGDQVEIAIKPYKGKKEKGIVERVLTKKKYHSRGHKVMLESGTVGRITKIIKKNKIKRKCANCQKEY